MLDTSAVADRLQIKPRIIRQYLRSSGSPFQPVGSGGRYEFHETDLDTLAEGLATWTRNKGTQKSTTPAGKPRREVSQEETDRAVWEREMLEGSIPLLDDIHDPAVRARVRRIAMEQEARLEQRLLAVGLHITQMRGRTVMA